MVLSSSARSTTTDPHQCQIQMKYMPKQVKAAPSRIVREGAGRGVTEIGEDGGGAGDRHTGAVRRWDRQSWHTLYPIPLLGSIHRHEAMWVCASHLPGVNLSCHLVLAVV